MDTSGIGVLVVLPWKLAQSWLILACTPARTQLHVAARTAAGLFVSVYFFSSFSSPAAHSPPPAV
jgi:hypothetical protein